VKLGKPDTIFRHHLSVVALPGVRRPMALGFKSDEIRRVLTVQDTPAS
jgi:hypothetical protein